MQVKSIAECSKESAFYLLLTFIELPFVIKIFALSILVAVYTGFTVYALIR